MPNDLDSFRAIKLFHCDNEGFAIAQAALHLGKASERSRIIESSVGQANTHGMPPIVCSIANQSKRFKEAALAG